MTITVCIPFSIKFIAVVFESGMFRWITLCYEFLVINISILLFAHGKIADANFPPVVSPALSPPQRFNGAFAMESALQGDCRRKRQEIHRAGSGGEPLPDGCPFLVHLCRFLVH